MQQAFSFLTSARNKLQWAIWAMRLLSAGYLVSVFWHIQNWWLDEVRVIRFLGNAYGKDLSGMQAWQRFGALGFDLLNLMLVVIAVMYCWRFLRTLQERYGFCLSGVQALLRCAYWASAAQALSLLARPLKSYWLTLHLSAPDREWRWSLYSADIQSTMLCLCLLMFAWMFAWALEIAEENRSFV